MDLLLTPNDVRTLAESLGTRPTKQWGQNFVIDPNTVRKIVSQAAVAPGAQVLEVGPGLGSLTLGLLEAGCTVTAIEIDPVLADALPQTVAARSAPAAERLRVLGRDALTVRGEEIAGEPSALVANLPYNVAVPVLLHLLAEVPSLERVLVMVQAEVADRLAAPPGSRTYGVPSVKAQWYSRVSLAGKIGRTVFWPAPRVDSGLVAFDRVEPPVTKASRTQVFAVIDAAFAQRRKTLRQALSGLAGSGQRAEEALVAAGLDPRIRGEQLRIEDFARVAEHLAADDR